MSFGSAVNCKSERADACTNASAFVWEREARMRRMFCMAGARVHARSYLQDSVIIGCSKSKQTGVEGHTCSHTEFTRLSIRWLQHRHRALRIVCGGGYRAHCMCLMCLGVHLACPIAVYICVCTGGGEDSLNDHSSDSETAGAGAGATVGMDDVPCRP